MNFQERLKSSTSSESVFFYLGKSLALSVMALGVFWAFQRGAFDFFVFYHAWGLVLAGKGREVYSNSPDFFLYAPGFAWILSPLAFLPRAIALGTWCAFKLLLILASIKRLARFVPAESYKIREGIAFWAFVLVSRPFLIDLQYGQVNSLIASTSILALTSLASRPEKKSSTNFLVVAQWFGAALAAFAKLFSLPLLMVPWFFGHHRNAAKFGILAAILLVYLIPCIQLSPAEVWHLMVEWKRTLFVKGLPIDSHNQSFAALLHHYFSGKPTPIIGEKQYLPLDLGWSILSDAQIRLLTLSWVAGGASLILVSFIWLPSIQIISGIGLFLGSFIVPSHLVWKSYFVMSYPLMVACLSLALSHHRVLAGVMILSVVFNLSGFDLTGHFWGPRLESASILFLIHLAWIAIIARAAHQKRDASRGLSSNHASSYLPLPVDSAESP